MRNALKNLFIVLPAFIKARALTCIEWRYRKEVRKKDSKRKLPPFTVVSPSKTKKRILVYHKQPFYFGGTERCLQIVVKLLSEEYDVFVMHSSALSSPNRKTEVEAYATLIPFSCVTEEASYPYYLHEMTPTLTQVIQELAIDLLIVSGPGKTEYPYITETHIPIIQMNNFGAPAMQENIKKILFVSEEIKNHSERYTGPRNKDEVLPIPIDTSMEKESVPSLREKLAIPSNAFIFGRIGRNSNDIYDPIGIEAFKQVVSTYADVHYVIISPPPLLEQTVLKENIPNVHFLPPTTNEQEIWSFHYGIDALAHFRYDGETQGLNIGEAMYAGKPVISHRSPIWNAHTAYLTPDFARIARQGDIDEYASYMKEFIEIRKTSPEKWQIMCQAAKQQADRLFSIETYKQSLLRVVSETI